MSLSLNIYSISLANPLLCFLLIQVFLAYFTILEEIFHGFGVFFDNFRLNLDPNLPDFHGFRGSFSRKMTTE